MKSRLFIILILSLFLWSCVDSDVARSMPQEPSVWVNAKVAVVLPLSGENGDKKRFERIYNMFEENVVKAQLNMDEGVKLELEWFDENTHDINILANELYMRDDIKAIIGPLNNDNIEKMANVMYDKGIPMFVMSSSEDIVRRYSSGTAGVAIKEPFLWSLSTTDVIQSRLILSEIASAGVKSVSVLSASNKYGETFNRWLPYYANEMKLDIIDREQYSTIKELEAQMDRFCKSETEVIICALDDVDAAAAVLQTARNNPSAPKVYFTGAVLNSSLFKLGTLAEGVEGFSMYSSPDTGFYLSYQALFGELPLPIESQLYDSFLLSLVSFAYCHYSGRDMSMNQVIEELSDLPLTTKDDIYAGEAWGTGTPIWNYSGLRDVVLNPLRRGEQPETNLIGAGGNLKFTAESYTSLVEGCHINWLIYNGQPVIMGYIDYFKYIWDWETMFDEYLDNSDSPYKYKMPKGYKAVLICGSEGWYNYRHQADVLYVYHSLKRNGFTDDDIILIMRDDIATHEKNRDQGVIKVSPNGMNLYQDIQLDYRADTLDVTDIKDILLGNKSDRLAIVLESTETDNVLLYWTGHGYNGAFSWLAKDKFTAEMLRETVNTMYENKHYQSMLICAEPCYSGSVVKAVEGIPLVLGIAAADENESSYADNFNPDLGVWMCDRFTYNLIRILDKEIHINFLDLYEKLNASTLGSHVKVYNSKMFYDLKTSGLSDYFYYYEFENN